jgi:predicted transcriptional regulator
MKKLVELVKKDKTTILRTLEQLENKGFVFKIKINGMPTKNNKKKGFSYEYYIIPKHYKSMKEFVYSQIDLLINQYGEL